MTPAITTESRHKTRPFIAIDGEGLTVDGHHRYIMMCASTGEYVEDLNGLGSLACLNWLMELRHAHPDAIFVSYAFSYDRTKILTDVVLSSPARAWALWRSQSTRWNDFLIGGIDKKWFHLSRDGTSMKVYDVSSFWQSSFVTALASAGITDATIEDMKQQRSTFDAAHVDDIRSYCLLECERLVQLMDWLRNSFVSVGIPLGKWHGPGAVAETVLKKHTVGRHHRHDSLQGIPADDATIFRAAYFGGRAQTLILGTVPDVYQYDINSAYPGVTRNLPTAYGEWRAARDYTVHPWACWLVRWRIPRGGPGDGWYGPFPWRHGNGSLWYPRNGYGWYYAPEVATALEYWPDCIDIERGYTFTPDTEEKPFAFIEQMYEQRAQLKREGHAGQLALKLSMNSVYGKLAQGVGGKRGRSPRWQSYFWAGNITSHTRAYLLRMAAEHQSSVIGYATDSVFFQEDPCFATDKNLGGLDRTHFTDGFFAQQGMYTGTIDGKQFEKTRSFVKGGLDWDAIRAGWKATGTDFTSVRPLTLFMSLGLSCARGRFSQYGEWLPVDKELTLTTSAHPNSSLGGNPRPDADGRKRALFLGGKQFDELSAPYRQKKIHNSVDALIETADWRL